MKPNYIVEAEALLGEKEVKGKLANEKIVELYADAGHPDVVSDEVPWCAAFVGACLARSNKPHTGTLLARDYLKYGKKLKKPQEYSIGVMRRGNSSWEGHVGFVVDFNDTHVWLLGGNQNNSVNITRYPRSQFLGFTVPEEKTMDITTPELVKSSRRMTKQNWFQRAYATIAAGVAGLWAAAPQVLELARDNAGWVLLGFLGLGWLSLQLLKGDSVREYREGRYQPNSQWN
jgi:uncharacterized protein (TIGR02594 family)